MLNSCSIVNHIVHALHPSTIYQTPLNRQCDSNQGKPLKLFPPITLEAPNTSRYTGYIMGQPRHCETLRDSRYITSINVDELDMEIHSYKAWLFHRCLCFAIRALLQHTIRSRTCHFIATQILYY